MFIFILKNVLKKNDEKWKKKTSWTKNKKVQKEKENSVKILYVIKNAHKLVWYMIKRLKHPADKGIDI